MTGAELNSTLVLHFNAFTGKLEGGYWLSRIGDGDPGRSSKNMKPAAIFAYLADHPTTRCAALKV